MKNFPTCYHFWNDWRKNNSDVLPIGRSKEMPALPKVLLHFCVPQVCVVPAAAAAATAAGGGHFKCAFVPSKLFYTWAGRKDFYPE